MALELVRAFSPKVGCIASASLSRKPNCPAEPCAQNGTQAISFGPTLAIGQSFRRSQFPAQLAQRLRPPLTDHRKSVSLEGRRSWRGRRTPQPSILRNSYAAEPRVTRFGGLPWEFEESWPNPSGKRGLLSPDQLIALSRRMLRRFKCHSAASPFFLPAGDEWMELGTAQGHQKRTPNRSQ
jgi:hypothetical protein